MILGKNIKYKRCIQWHAETVVSLPRLQLASGCIYDIMTQNHEVGETGYGCHTFYITDVFRNIVIIADIRLLLCLNIVSCAHINMQFVIFNS